MAMNDGLVIMFFVLFTTSLAIGFGFGIKAQRLPFSAEIGFSEQQVSLLKWWVKLALSCWRFIATCYGYSGMETAFLIGVLGELSVGSCCAAHL